MLSDLRFRLRALFGQAGMERELDDELREHLERQTAKYVMAGMPEGEADRRARVEFGGIENVKEESRDARGVALIETAIRDIRYGARILWKSPAFTLVAVLSLALGIGANTAIFQLLDVLRMRTLPVAAPRELAWVRVPDMSLARGSVNTDGGLTYALWEQIRHRQTAFSGLFAWSPAGFNLSPAGEVRTEYGMWVSGDFFQVLGVTPVMGRVFSRADDVRGCGTPGAVISYAFWQSEFGGSAGAIGRTVRLNGHAVPVIGVTRPGFTGLEVGRQFQVAVPICSASVLWFDATSAGTLWWLDVMGRLKPGVSAQQAAAQMKVLSPAVFKAALPPDYPPASVKDYLGMKLDALPAGAGFSGLRDVYSKPLTMLLAIAALVLLIACANLANLMLARASAREREIAVRLAIGASRARLITQLMTESLLLATAGAGLALLLSGSLSRALIRMLSNGDSSIFLDLHLDWRVMAFAASLGVLTCVVFGLTPALRATGDGPGPLLKSAGRGLTANRERFGLRRLLVASQIAFSLFLLVGAMLFVRSLQNLMQAQTGFRQEGILIADLSFARANPASIPAFQKTLLARIRAVPGVISAAGTSVVPLSGGIWDNRVWPDGKDMEHSSETLLTRISPRYFRTLETPVLSGRDFDDNDAPGSAKVAIVNQVFAKKIVGEGNPIGRQFHIEATPSNPETVYQIVGLVVNTKYRNLRGEFEPIAYLPLAQNADPSLSNQLLIRSSLPPASLLPSLRRAIGEVDPNAGFSFQEFTTQIGEMLLPERLMATLSTAFGMLAGLLSAIGIYGVISYLVARRRNEIGIRMALGADRAQILGMVLRESVEVLAMGLAGGTVLALGAGAFAGSMFFGLKAYDARVLGSAAALLALVAMAATWFPARRAANVDPTIALRDE